MGARTMNLVIQKTGGKEYVSFRESFWDPVRKKTSSRTVRNFGRLDLLLAQDPEALDKLRAQAEELKKAHQESKNALLQERVKEALSVKARGASTGDSRRGRQKFRVCEIIGTRPPGASNEHEYENHQAQLS